MSDTTPPAAQDASEAELDIEPKVLLDVSGSMARPCAPGSLVTRLALAKQIIGQLTVATEGMDTAGKDEVAGGKTAVGTTEEDEGGLEFTLFSDTGVAIGDLTSANFDKLFAKVVPGGGTYLMEGIKTVNADYQEEFGSKPASHQPVMMLWIVTDGEPQDKNEVAQWLMSATGKVRVECLVMGYGDDHNKALAAWNNIAATNHHVVVKTVTDKTDVEAMVKEMVAAIQ